jgi:acyl-CoA thioester hydrolase
MHDPHVPPTEEMRFVARVRTRWSDEDNQAVLNNAVYLTLFEEARHAYFERLGLLQQNRFPFLLAQTHVRFLRPGRGGVDVGIEVRTLRLGNSSFEQAYRLRVEGSAEVWAEAQALLVLYDPASGGRRPMDAEFRARIAALEGL